MKSGPEVASDTYQLLNVADFTSLITGGVYLVKRPQNSQLQDVVINALSLTNDQLQKGTINVNVYAPNLQLKIKGKTDTTQPDMQTLAALGKIVLGKIGDIYGGEYRLWVSQPGLIYPDDDGSYFMNIRANYLFFQQNYSNI